MSGYFRASIKFKWNGEWTFGKLMPFVPGKALEAVVDDAANCLEDGEELVVLIPPTRPQKLIHKTKTGEGVETSAVTEEQQQNLKKIFDDLQGSSAFPDLNL